ncbi:MAG: M23 family metallopeptidase [Bacilli bacterium]
MESRRIKKSAVYAIYSIGIIALIGTIYLIETSIAKDSFKENDDNYGYVSKTIFDETVPVMNEANGVQLIRPYTDEKVKIVKNYYDYKGEEETQKNSIFFHEDTYMQSTGVSYGGVDDFDVVAVLDGTVTSVREDELLGIIVEIKHNNNLTSVYQSLKDVSVKKDDKVSQGQPIAKAGTSNIDTSLKNHVYFELIQDGKVINPEEQFNNQQAQ